MARGGTAATHHAIMLFSILSLLLLLPHIPIFIAPKTKPNNISGTPPPFPSSNCSNSSWYPVLYFLCGVLFTSILITTINLPSFIQNLLETVAITAVDVSSTCFRRFKQWSPRLAAAPDHHHHHNDAEASNPVGCPGGGSNGLHPSLLKTLPTFAYSTTYQRRSRSGIDMASVCVICSSEFREDERISWLPDCDHLFHSDCIDLWFCSNRTCPCCRISLA